jgi:hypothetical protein
MRLFFYMLVIVFFSQLAACLPERDTEPTLVAPETAEAPVNPGLIGKLLKGSRGETYRLMENGLIRPISDWATYLALGYEADDVITVSDEELAGHPLGLPLTRWMTGGVDTNVYFLIGGKRYRVPDAQTFEAMGGSPLDVSLVPDAFLESIELEPDPLPNATLSENERAYPESTAVLLQAVPLA